MKTKTVTEIEYHELEDLVKEKLGYKNYSFVAVEECGNDSSHEFTVEKGFEDSEYDKEQIEKWEKGEFVQFSNHVILNKLCMEGHIPAGNYIVQVCW
jgi:hypothetical protein